MKFIQYYHYDLAGKLSEACGDRSVFILDGRNNLATMHNDAIANNGVRRPVYNAYRLYSGRSFIDCQPISGIIPL